MSKLPTFPALRPCRAKDLSLLSSVPHLPSSQPTTKNCPSGKHIGTVPENQRPGYNIGFPSLPREPSAGPISPSYMQGLPSRGHGGSNCDITRQSGKRWDEAFEPGQRCYVQPPAHPVSFRCRSRGAHTQVACLPWATTTYFRKSTGCALPSHPMRSRCGHLTPGRLSCAATSSPPTGTCQLKSSMVRRTADKPSLARHRPDSHLSPTSPRITSYSITRCESLSSGHEPVLSS